MKKLLGIVILGLLFLVFFNTAFAGTQQNNENGKTTSSYEDAVSKWKSYKDVATWLNRNFVFDKNRQKQIHKLLKKQGPSGLIVRNPASLYEDNHNGYCGDSANFAIKSLNKIDPSYNADGYLYLTIKVPIIGLQHLTMMENFISWTMAPGESGNKCRAFTAHITLLMNTGITCHH